MITPLVLLNLWDGKVILANNGREALEKVRLNRPNVIVLDMVMPEMDGFEVESVMERAGRSAPGN